MEEYKIIEIKESIFEDNNKDAECLREELLKDGTFLINLMSSPGAGKTTFLLSTIELLQEEFRIGIMEADIDSDVDARTISDKTNAKVIQLHTGGMCHLDADMTRQGLHELDSRNLDLVVLENVGNLVCPAEFDTGANLKVLILSVPEGDDKPYKYPLAFEVADVLIINKIDVKEYFDFDFARAIAEAKRLNPNVKVFPLSGKTKEGIRSWAEYLAQCIMKYKEKQRDLCQECIRK
ncbi:MAG: hydrogenase nickel incorporation protein HypB [Erysipelotrichaceae bacterium]|nr:hydrogenase nickel incorporation protein HypB [Erysipelotrichaceae bacterium]